jgi:putative SOS response-associated peptidase YedK
MPAILSRENQEAWLTGSMDEARAVLRPYEPGLMVAFEVSTAVNSPKNNNDKLLEPVARGNHPKIAVGE